MNGSNENPDPLSKNPVNGSDPKYIVLVENLGDWKSDFPDLKVVTGNDYLSNAGYLKLKNAKVINLCRSYRYLSRGYFCSLLAEARRHKIMPTVRTLRDLSTKSIYKLEAEDLDELIRKSFKKNRDKHVDRDSISITICFGECDYPLLQELAEEIFDTFRCPILKAEFRHDMGKWEIASIRPLTLNSLAHEKKELFIHALDKYTKKRWMTPREKSVPRYDLAVLYNPDEKFPPSNRAALKNFIRVGKSLNLDVELIRKKDYPRLAEYDALFIRETTALENHTYRFSKKAMNEGLVVIDDPNSIRRCTNKVFLAEILMANKIPVPKSFIYIKDSKTENLENHIPYPVVLKIPDGSFSRGVFKADNREDLERIASDLFKESDIILAQEFLYTEFDWRIGILNKTPVYASKYFMSKKHWQIYNHGDRGRVDSGLCETIPVEEAPEEVVKTALKAANLIGDGLYGVDLKHTEKGVVVIEVNDNPSIDSGVEDIILKDELYRIILQDFIHRIENMKKNR